jgi:TRAP-type C4-dicarboxylate transport system permease small subunit
VSGGLLSTVNDGLERLALGAVIVMMAIMCALTFAQAAGRYALSFSLTWSEELTRFMLVWVSMLGGAVAARRRMHVGFEALTGALPRRLGQAVRLLGLVLAMGIFGTMVWYGTTLARFNMLQVSAALEWPMGVPYAAIPVGAALFVLFLLEDFVRLLGDRERPAVPGELDPGSGSSA